MVEDGAEKNGQQKLDFFLKVHLRQCSRGGCFVSISSDNPSIFLNISIVRLLRKCACGWSDNFERLSTTKERTPSPKFPTQGWTTHVLCSQQ
jgi:hypothetical protein